MLSPIGMVSISFVRRISSGHRKLFQLLSAIRMTIAPNLRHHQRNENAEEHAVFRTPVDAARVHEIFGQSAGILPEEEGRKRRNGERDNNPHSVLIILKLIISL